MEDVFLVFAENDRANAELIAAALRDSGVTVWADHPTLPVAGSGPLTRSELGPQVARQLTTAACVVLLESPGTASWLDHHAHRYGTAEQRLWVEIKRPLVQQFVRKVLPSADAVGLSSWKGSVDDAVFNVFLDKVRQRIDSVRMRRADAVGPHPPVPQAITSRGARPLFISYRREDTAHAAGRLHERLADAFGLDRVFMDIDAVPLGVDFVDHISEQIVGCSAVIVLIGRQWLTATDRNGRARLSNESDFVRTEVSAALRMKVPVIPVLVDDADMPNPDELPDDLRPLARRNGIELSATRWRTDVERLIKELDRVMKPSGDSEKAR